MRGGALTSDRLLKTKKILAQPAVLPSAVRENSHPGRRPCGPLTNPIQTADISTLITRFATASPKNNGESQVFLLRVSRLFRRMRVDNEMGNAEWGMRNEESCNGAGCCAAGRTGACCG